MSSKILIDTLRQPTSWTCFHTCLVMLDKYRSSRAGVFHHPSELEAMLYPDSRKQSIDPRMNAHFLGKGPTHSQLHEYHVRKYGNKQPTGLLSPAEARELAKLMDFTYSTTKADPNSFERILSSYGPFIWVGNLRHTVLVTSLDRRGDRYFVSFNDPDGGRRREEEFYGFLLELMPSMKVLGVQMYEAFHIKR